MQIFCDEMPKIYEDNKWRLAFDRPGGVISHGLSLEAQVDIDSILTIIIHYLDV